MIKYKELHAAFLPNESEYFASFQSTFNAIGRSMSTNGKYLLSTPIIDKYLEDRSEKVKKVMMFEENSKIIIKLSELIDIKNLVPKVDEEKVLTKEKKCSECDGDGEVEWEYGFHTKMGDCPECDGEGVVEKEVKIKTGNKISDGSSIVSVFGARLRYDVLEKLIFVCEQLNKDAILIHKTDSNHQYVFRCGDCDILLMPTTSEIKPFYTLK